MVPVRPGRGLPTSAPAWPTGERSTPAGLGGCPERSRPFSSVQTSCPAWRRIDLVNTRRILSRCASVDAFDGGWGGCPEWSRPFSSVQTSSLARRKIDCVNANCILSYALPSMVSMAMSRMLLDALFLSTFLSRCPPLVLLPSPPPPVPTNDDRPFDIPLQSPLFLNTLPSMTLPGLHRSFSGRCLYRAFSWAGGRAASAWTRARRGPRG